MGLRDKYEFDARFYAIAVAAILLVGIGFYFAKKSIDRAHGREIQSLITKAGVGTPESARKSARNYVNTLKQQRSLTGEQVEKAEEIFTRGFMEWQRIWIDDRVKGAPPDQTKRKQMESWSRHHREFEAVAGAK